jgi:hypothetical protein
MSAAVNSLIAAPPPPPPLPAASVAIPPPPPPPHATRIARHFFIPAVGVYVPVEVSVWTTTFETKSVNRFAMVIFCEAVVPISTIGRTSVVIGLVFRVNPVILLPLIASAYTFKNSIK